MPVFKTAYDTSACQGLQMEKTKNAILEASIRGEIIRDDFDGLQLIKRTQDQVGLIPSFSHPVTVHFRGSDYDDVVIDVRPMVRMDMKTYDYKIVSDTEYELMRLRGALNVIWLTDHGVATIRDVSPVAMAIYAAWISQSITRRFALERDEQLKLAMYAAFFYANLFIPAGMTYTERDITKIASRIVAATKCSPDEALAMVDQLIELEMHSIFDFCKHAEEIVGTIRLRDLNPGVLIALVAGSWFGPTAKEMIAVALEHPPTWIAILQMAFTSKAYKKTFITGLTEIYGSRGNDVQFVQGVKLITKPSDHTR